MSYRVLSVVTVARSRWGRAALGALLALAVLWLPARALAFEPVELEPEPDVVLGATPEVITITFDEPLRLQPGANFATIWDQEGNGVPGRSEIAGYSPHTLLLHPSGELPEGLLIIHWHAVSAESGAESDGIFQFTLTPGAAPQAPSPAVVVAAPSERSSESIVLWTVAILGGSALVAFVLYLLRRELGLGKSSLEGGGDAHY